MTDKDFSQLDYNPLELKEGELIQKKYKFFSKREVFTKTLVEIASDEDVNSNPDILQDDESVLSDIIKFVILFIDQDSPFYDEDNFDERLQGCLHWANIDKESRAMYHIIGETEWYRDIEAHYFYHVVDNAKFEDWYSKKKGAMSMKKFLRTPISESENPESTVKAMLLISQNLDKETDAYMKLQSEVFPKNKRLQKRLKRQMDNIEANKETITGYAEKKAKAVPR